MSEKLSRHLLFIDEAAVIPASGKIVCRKLEFYFEQMVYINARTLGKRTKAAHLSAAAQLGSAEKEYFNWQSLRQCNSSAH